MNEAQAITAMMQAVRDDITWPGTPPTIVRENVEAAGKPEYILVYPEFGKSEQRTMGTRGNRTWKRPGVLMFAIHTPLGTGNSRARALVDAIEEYIEGEKIGGIIYREKSDVDKGKTASHHYVVIGIAFEYYQRK